ncbi:hypothetical protein Btru_037449 [Bulinus truncatus]|nr:hypothetical protein Btru_037449 [Bulinus truncatus]
MADPSVDELKKAVKGILKGADLDSLSTKKVRKMLEDTFKTDFSSRKKEIDKLVMKMIDDEDDEEEKEKKEDSDDEHNGVEDADSDDEAPKKKAKKEPAAKPKKRKSATKADDSEDPVMSEIKELDDEDLAKKLQEEETGLRRRRAAAPRPKKEKERDPDKKKKPSAYSRPCHLSDQLAAVVGTNEMPRAEVVKTLWSIVKERNLQDPKNKQFMLCDEQMETLFGSKRIKLFGMMNFEFHGKFIKSNIYILVRKKKIMDLKCHFINVKCKFVKVVIIFHYFSTNDDVFLKDILKKLKKKRKYNHFFPTKFNISFAVRGHLNWKVVMSSCIKCCSLVHIYRIQLNEMCIGEIIKKHVKDILYFCFIFNILVS